MGEKPRLVFDSWVDEAWLCEVEQKSYCNCAEAVCPDGRRYKITCFVPLRLQQELDTLRNRGENWIGEVGLIVVTETTVPVMEAAIAALWKEGWFNHLKPVEDADCSVPVPRG